MRRNRCHRQHERLLCRHSVVEKTVSFRSHDICRVFALVRYGRIMVSLERCVHILIREWIKQEVRSREPGSVRLVVIVNFLGVEEFSDVVGVVAG